MTVNEGSKLQNRMNCRTFLERKGLQVFKKQVRKQLETHAFVVPTQCSERPQLVFVLCRPCLKIHNFPAGSLTFSFQAGPAVMYPVLPPGRSSNPTVGKNCPWEVVLGGVKAGTNFSYILHRTHVNKHFCFYNFICMSRTPAMFPVQLAVQ